MRKLKFRAFLKNNRKMYDVLTLDIIDQRALIENTEDKRRPLRGYVKMSEIELMQFTGLKDTNGREIYEGDIIKVIFEYSEMDGTPNNAVDFGEVLFDENSACYIVCGVNKTMGELSDWHQEKLYVIGNIYENPELLEAKNV